jgi:hypothetical protein
MVPDRNDYSFKVRPPQRGKLGVGERVQRIGFRLESTHVSMS